MDTKNQFCYEYPRPAVTADCVIFGYTGSELQLLLIERGNEPFKGEWALPGGFLNMDEDADTCARRELQEETGLENVYMEQLYTFSRVDRDPRGRVITVAYYALVNLFDYQVKAGDDAVNARWFALSELPELAFDHADIIQTAIGRLRGKIRYQPLGFELLPEQFTIPELQRLYESTLQTTLDRRNFRKKILSTGLLIDLGKDARRMEAHKKAKRYCFDKIKYSELSQKGFYFEI